MVSRREARQMDHARGHQNCYHSASFVGNNRVVFNIRGNQHRLVMGINYAHGLVYIRYVGSHQDYDKIDAATI